MKKLASTKSGLKFQWKYNVPYFTPMIWSVDSLVLIIKIFFIHFFSRCPLPFSSICWFHALHLLTSYPLSVIRPHQIAKTYSEALNSYTYLSIMVKLNINSGKWLNQKIKALRGMWGKLCERNERKFEESEFQLIFIIVYGDVISFETCWSFLSHCLSSIIPPQGHSIPSLIEYVSKRMLERCYLRTDG